MALRAAQAHSDSSPRQHQKGDPSARPELLEEVVRRNLKQGVRNKKDHEGDGVLKRRHVRLGEEIIASRRVQHLGIANVGPIQVA